MPSHSSIHRRASGPSGRPARPLAADQGAFAAAVLRGVAALFRALVDDRAAQAVLLASVAGRGSIPMSFAGRSARDGAWTAGRGEGSAR